MNAEISDKEFSATFSLLPKVLDLLKKLSTVQGDVQKQVQLIQATVRVRMSTLDSCACSNLCSVQADELKVQYQRCRQVLECSPYLDQTPEHQQMVLSQKQDKLRRSW